MQPMNYVLLFIEATCSACYFLNDLLHLAVTLHWEWFSFIDILLFVWPFLYFTNYALWVSIVHSLCFVSNGFGWWKEISLFARTWYSRFSVCLWSDYIAKITNLVRVFQFATNDNHWNWNWNWTKLRAEMILKERFCLERESGKILSS